MTNTFIRLPQVLRATGLSRSTIYALVRAGAFPKPVKLSRSAVGWPAAHVEEWAQRRLDEARARA